VALLAVRLRVAAGSLAASGIIVAALLPLHPSIFDRPVGEVVADTPLWTAIHFAGVLAFPLAFIGAVGMVAAQGDRVRRLGRAGLLVTLVGTFAGTAVAAIEASVFPLLAERSPGLLAIDGPILLSWQFVLIAVLALGWPLGLAMIGLSAMRAGRYPRTAGLLLAISGPLFLLLAGPFVPVAGVLSSLLFGGVQVWWAVLLWRTDDAPRLTTARSY
jgi:hypothetical protein